MYIRKMEASCQRGLSGETATAAGELSPPPKRHLAATEFVELLLEAAAECDARASHPAWGRIVQASQRRERLQSWVPLAYRAVLTSMRTHALAAACAADGELYRAVLAYAGIEADADPVGGAYFSLPQLWIKFGIALGVSREEIVNWLPPADVLELEARQLAQARAWSRVPVSLFVNAMLDPILASSVGARLHEQLGLKRDALDYFWAIAGNRWGEDTGRPLLESLCTTAEAQQSMWTAYTAELASSMERAWLDLLLRAMDSSSEP